MKGVGNWSPDTYSLGTIYWGAKARGGQGGLLKKANCHSKPRERTHVPFQQEHPCCFLCPPHECTGGVGGCETKAPTCLLITRQPPPYVSRSSPRLGSWPWLLLCPLLSLLLSGDYYYLCIPSPHHVTVMLDPPRNAT